MAYTLDIYISYRPGEGSKTAKMLCDQLTRDSYRAYMDIEALRGGLYDDQQLGRIDVCEDFLLIIDPHAFDDALKTDSNPKTDWLRQELAYALRKKKHIIPIFTEGVKEFPNNLPEDIKAVTQLERLTYNNEEYEMLKERFLQSKKVNRNILLTTIIFIGLIALFIAGVFLYISIKIKQLGPV